MIDTDQTRVTGAPPPFGVALIVHVVVPVLAGIPLTDAPNPTFIVKPIWVAAPFSILYETGTVGGKA